MPMLRLTGQQADPYLFPIERDERPTDRDVQADLEELRDQVEELLGDVDDLLGPLPFSRSRAGDDDRPTAA